MRPGRRSRRAAWAGPRRPPTVERARTLLRAPGSHGRIQSSGGSQTRLERRLQVPLPAIAGIGPFPASHLDSGYAHFLHTWMDKREAAPRGEAPRGGKECEGVDMRSGCSGS